MPSTKKQRAKKKKAAAAAAAASPPKRSPAIAAAASRIYTANSTPDLCKGLEAFLSIDLPAATAPPKSCAGAAAAAAPIAAADPVRLEIRSPKTLAEGDARSLYDLLKRNMYDMYVEAGWGWNEAEKWREMEHRDARFLIARCGGSGGGSTGGSSTGGTAGESGGKPAVAAAAAGIGGVTISGGGGESGAGRAGGGASGGAGLEPGDEQKQGSASGCGERVAGYCHFRFAWDQDENEDGEGVGGTEDVLYVYELQVAPWAKRRGLGRRMMQALELLANRHGMTKVMLTVFKENSQAMSFYTKKMKYGVDKDSPSNWDQPDEVYEILSKPTRHGLVRAKESKLTARLLD